jgi:hypothetical protein
MTTRGLIITGMHRSGTSLIAQAFFKAGVFLGDDLLSPSPRNPDGFFEDKKVIQFHDEVLQENNAEWHSYWRSQKKLSVSSKHKNEAGKLMGEYFQGHGVWGWKDPRAILFLDLWHELFPQAKFVFAYRKPEEVVWSLIRRGDFHYYFRHPILRAIIALRLWSYYNRRILEFAGKYPGSSLLLCVPGDLLDAQTRSSTVKIITDQWSYDLKELDNQLSQTYKPTLMHREVRAWIKALTKIYWPAEDLFRRLNHMHDKLLFQNQVTST